MIRKSLVLAVALVGVLAACTIVPQASANLDALSRAATLTTLEGESQNWTVSSGDTASKSSTTVRLQANAVGDTFSFTGSVPAGTYSVTLKYLQRNLYGIYSVKINGTQVGANVDSYNANSSDVAASLALGNVTLSAATSTFLFTVTGKNASATDYDFKLDSLVMTPASGTATATPAATATQTPSPTPSATPTVSLPPPTATPVATATKTPSPTPTKTPSPTPAVTATPAPTATPSGTGKTYYVSPSGKSTNDGASFATALDYASALSKVVAGDTVLLQAGTYSITYTSGAKNSVVFSKSGQSGKPITWSAYNNGQAVFDFQFPASAWVQDSFGFSVTGSYWYFKGIKITRAGYQGAYVTGGYNTFDNCVFYDNRNTGLEINKGGNHTTVLNCDAYRNYDPKKNGSMADGFGPKQTQGAGNKFIGCRSWENSDDGYDAFDSPEVVTFENCWAFRNGNNYWNDPNFVGNANGFKIGGNSQQANHKLTNCVVFSQPAKGFDQNNNTGGLTLYNCVAYQNGTNWGLGGTLNAGQTHVLKNNVSLGGTNADAFGSATQQKNSWNSPLSVSAADFVSLDLSLATIARNADGSLPATNLFRLQSTSQLVDAGVNVGLPYNGAAPDVGAFER